MLQENVLRQFQIPNELPMMIDYLQQNGEELSWPILMAFWNHEITLKKDEAYAHIYETTLYKSDEKMIDFIYCKNSCIWLVFYSGAKYRGFWDIAGSRTRIFETSTSEFVEDFKPKLEEISKELKRRW